MKNLLLIFSLLGTTAAFAQFEPYDINGVIAQVGPASIGTLTEIHHAPPATLYHWISVESLKRLIPDPQHLEAMPMKKVGTNQYRSIFVVNAPGFNDRSGLFAWHNPLGATSGGSNELYGNHEAVLAMKIDPQVRMGLIVTSDTSQKTLSDPSIGRDFDLILHVYGDAAPSGFIFLYVEWILLNPKSVLSISANPTETIAILEQMKAPLRLAEAERGNSFESPMQVAFGMPHVEMGSYGMNEARVQRLQDSLQKNRRKLPAWAKSGWIAIDPCKGLLRAQ